MAAPAGSDSQAARQWMIQAEAAALQREADYSVDSQLRNLLPFFE